MINSYKNKCVYVIDSTKPANDLSGRCNKPTTYKIVRDDDGNKVRKYNFFCDEHLSKVNEDIEE